MKERVFISYAREDNDFVMQLATKLLESNISVWLDKWNIPTGADWDQSIDHAIEECGKIIIVLSPYSVNSIQVRGEIQASIEAGKHIIPVLYKNCSIPRNLRLLQYFDFTSLSMESESFDKLVRDLQTHQPLIPKSRDVLDTSTHYWKQSWIIGLLCVIVLIAGTTWLVQPAYLMSIFNSSSDSPSEARRREDRGDLQVSVNADSAHVTLDGVEVGIARRGRPLFLRGIKTGQYRIEVISRGYESQNRRINIAKNKISEVEFILYQSPILQ